MKRKITNLEQKLINDGWCLTIKRYIGKHSEKTFCYEYHKTSDLRNESKTYEQIIKLDQKRSQIVDYGIKSVFVDFLNDQELTFVRSLFLMLRLYVEKLTENVWWQDMELKQDNGKPLSLDNIEPLTNDEIVELCEEIENAKSS